MKGTARLGQNGEEVLRAERLGPGAVIINSIFSSEVNMLLPLKHA